LTTHNIATERKIIDPHGNRLPINIFILDWSDTILNKREGAKGSIGCFFSAEA
jgi:hypothetical protein|tara:strand:+ start:354 stop:512 length:159 start_codon:yes stop_codon:yes gene_type:complete